VCVIPFMFLLRTKKIDKATIQKISEESHWDLWNSDYEPQKRNVKIL
jgi:hypothetical protein